MNYAKGLRRARADADFSQRKLAQRAGFDASYLSQLESGKRKPSLEALEKLSFALGMPMNVLLLMCADASDLRGIERKDVKALLDRLLKVLGRTTDE